MNILYQNHKLQKYAEDDNFSKAKLGPLRSELYQKRIGDMLAAQTLEDLRYVPGHYHELVGNRKGEWTCDLDQPYRMIFEPYNIPIPTDRNGKYIWEEIKVIIVTGIEDYH